MVVFKNRFLTGGRWNTSWKSMYKLHSALHTSSASQSVRIILGFWNFLYLKPLQVPEPALLNSCVTSILSISVWKMPLSCTNSTYWLDSWRLNKIKHRKQYKKNALLNPVPGQSSAGAPPPKRPHRTGPASARCRRQRPGSSFARRAAGWSPSWRGRCGRGSVPRRWAGSRSRCPPRRSGPSGSAGNAAACAARPKARRARPGLCRHPRGAAAGLLGVGGLRTAGTGDRHPYGPGAALPAGLAGRGAAGGAPRRVFSSQVDCVSGKVFFRAAAGPGELRKLRSAERLFLLLKKHSPLPVSENRGTARTRATREREASVWFLVTKSEGLFFFF